MAPKAADISVTGAAPWGGGRNGLPSGRPYVWHRRERRTAGPLSRCEKCGYLETAPGHEVTCDPGGGGSSREAITAQPAHGDGELLTGGAR